MIRHQKHILASILTAAFVVSMLVIAFVATERGAEPVVESPMEFVAFDAPADESVDDSSIGGDEKEPEAEEEPEMAKPAPKKTTKKSKPVVKQEKWKSAVLQVVTNFDKADVTINGMAYPEYVEPGKEDGMVLPAGGPYHVIVTYDGKTKNYKINLRPNETRLLFVELTGFQGGGGGKPIAEKAPPPAKAEKKEETKKEEKAKEPGRVTVYSKPPGKIMVDGTGTGEKTPGTVEVENGRHEVQVEYESGEISEKKIVRVRDGSRIKLFFRERKK